MNRDSGARADLSCRGDTDTDSAASLCRNTKKRDLSAMLLLLDDVHEDAASCAQHEEERDPYDYFYGVVDVVDDIATAPPKAKRTCQGIGKGNKNRNKYPAGIVSNIVKNT
jgi:hypothetical protein